MNQLDYSYYVDIVTKRYFHGVDNYNMEQVLDCFHDDATLMEVTSSTVHRGIDGIRTMFEGLFAAHTRIWHGNFVHTADVKENAVCSQFSVEVTPTDAAEPLRYENCNRFYLEGDRFKNVYVYMSGENLLK